LEEKVPNVGTARLKYRCDMLESLIDPHFDDGLPGHTKTSGLFIERFNHPNGEIHIDPSCLNVGAACFAEIKLI